MSALVILECNACGAITPPWPSADRAREEAGPDGWAVDVDGSNVDYCPQCTAPALGGVRIIGANELGDGGGVRSRLDAARIGVEQLRDALVTIAATAATMTPHVLGSVAALAATRADQIIAELAA